MEEPQREFRYLIDAQDSILSVDENWVAFARANWDPDFSPDRVVGTQIWSHIGDLGTRYLFGLLLDRVRKTGRSVFFPFRCDSPETKRFMEMHLAPGGDGSVEFVSHLVREEPLESGGPLLDGSLPRSAASVKLCSWCKRVARPPWMDPDSPPLGSWLEIEDVFPFLGENGSPGLPLVSHVACQECYEMVMDQVREMDS